jgi:prepilin-type N-terminal cleavage/methylation domain-containing protein
MQTRAFTLIEILVAVVIISVVGLSLLKINANHTNLFKFSIDRIDVNRFASIYLNHYDESLEMREYSILEVLKSSYPEITNDELRRYLDEIKVSIKKEEIERIKLFEEDDSEIVINRLNINYNDSKTGYYKFDYEVKEAPVTQSENNENQDNKDNTNKNTSSTTDSGSNQKSDSALPPMVGGKP